MKEKKLSMNKYGDSISKIEDNSLLITALTGNVAAKSIIELPVDQIRPDPNQPRKDFNEDYIKELADSMRENGLLSAIHVRPDTNGHIIISGERRYRAAQRLEWKTIPCVVVNISDDKAYQQTLVENLQRRDLNVYEEALGYKYLKDIFRMNQDDIAQKVGKSQATVSTSLKIASMPNEAFQFAWVNKVSKEKVQKVANLDDPKIMLEVLNQIVKENKSREEVGTLVKKKTAKDRRGRPSDSPTIKLGKETVLYEKKTNQYFKKHISSASLSEKKDLEIKLSHHIETMAKYLNELRLEMKIDGSGDVI